MTQANPPSHVFLLIGQSNMSGRAPLLDEDGQSIKGVRLMDNFGQWVEATQPLNRYSICRGPLERQRFCLGETFATAILDAGHAQSVGLIVNAMGGSQIEWWQPNEPLYHAALTRWIDAGRPSLAGVLWHQGESNEHDSHYFYKILALFTALRKDLGQPDLPIVLGHVIPGAVVNPQTDHAARALGHAGVVDIQDLTSYDGVHFDRKSMIELGRRYAKMYRSLT